MKSDLEKLALSLSPYLIALNSSSTAFVNDGSLWPTLLNSPYKSEISCVSRKSSKSSNSTLSRYLIQSSSNPSFVNSSLLLTSR